MFFKRRNELKSHTTPCERGDRSRVRGQLERLEERAMLSASYGDFQSGVAHVEPYGFPQMRFAEPPVATSQRFIQGFDRAPSYDIADEAGPPRHGKSDPPSMAALGQPMSGMQSAAGQPPASHAYSTKPQAAPTSYLSPGSTIILWGYFNSNPATSTAAHDFGTDAAADTGEAPPPRLGLKLNPSLVDTGTDTYGLVDVPNVGSHTQPPAPLPHFDSIRVMVPPAVQLAAAAVSTQSDSPVASAFASKEGSSVMELAAVAREMVFQELSSQLFQVASASSNERVSTNSVVTDSLTVDDLNGLIRVADESVLDGDAVAQDAVLRELEAVDAVLGDLHDLDLLLPSVAGIEIPLNLNLESGSDGPLGGEIDGGMVLLQATGDANANVFAATLADLEQLASAEPAKMEVAVGMLQAVDVAADQAPRIESAPPANASSAAARDAKLNESVLRENGHASSGKAAAAIGATTLTGALVWATQRRAREDRRMPAAQNRRGPLAK